MHSEGKLISKITIPKDSNNRKIVRKPEIQNNLNVSNRYNLKKLILLVVMLIIICIIVSVVESRKL